MATALPGNIQLKLDQTLAQWRHWDCEPALASAPTVRQMLGKGLSNYSVLVQAEGAFVVRLDGIMNASDHLNRQAEWCSLQAAHRAGIAPRPCYFNPELGCVVCEYLPPDTALAPTAPAVAALLRDVHSLPPRHHRLDLEARILSYEKRLEHRREPALAQLHTHGQAIRQCLAGAQTGAQPLVLCHNDLLRANRISSGGRLWAIDWEYCAMGSPWYDLAVVAAGDDLDDSASALLLESYLGRQATAAEYTRLRQYGCVYRYLELLWYLAREHPLLGQGQISEKLNRLEKALASALNP
jgi:thiamine kinase-like enzyme